jgi:RimJ/RimL family protein N-acetyltransferase
MGEVVYETQRLTVRRWSEADVGRLFEIYSHPDVGEHIPDLLVQSVDQIHRRMPRILASYESYGEGFGVWAAVRKSDDVAVGTVILKNLPDADEQMTEDREVGWHLSRECWGQGYATEMADGALAYGFGELGLDRILAVTSTENVRSIAVMERLGMVHQGMTQAYYGKDLALYDIRPERFSAGLRSYL